MIVIKPVIKLYRQWQSPEMFRIEWLSLATHTLISIRPLSFPISSKNYVSLYLHSHIKIYREYIFFYLDNFLKLM